jgi:hypothetical protein
MSLEREEAELMVERCALDLRLAIQRQAEEPSAFNNRMVLEWRRLLIQAQRRLDKILGD